MENFFCSQEKEQFNIFFTFFGSGKFFIYNNAGRIQDWLAIIYVYLAPGPVQFTCLADSCILFFLEMNLKNVIFLFFNRMFEY